MYTWGIEIPLVYNYTSILFILPETGEILRSKCPNKLYTFNRRPGIKFLPPNVKKINVQSRGECQDKCLQGIVVS